MKIAVEIPAIAEMTSAQSVSEIKINSFSVTTSQYKKVSSTGRALRFEKSMKTEKRKKKKEISMLLVLLFPL
jgi:hypothetical protein